jgi:hypothetical protein
VAANQGGSRGTDSSKRHTEVKYTLDAALDQPCKFHNTPGRVATHSTRQCCFIKELEQRARQLPGLPSEKPADGQEHREHEPAARRPDQGEDDYSTVFKQYHIERACAPMCGFGN